MAILQHAWTIEELVEMDELGWTWDSRRWPAMPAFFTEKDVFYGKRLEKIVRRDSSLLRQWRMINFTALVTLGIIQ